MLKGVNRQVVEIPQPESAYFEKVIFFVKPEFSGVSEIKLRSSADSLIKKASSPPEGKTDNNRLSRIRQIIKFTAAATIGAVMSAVGFFAFN